MHMKENSLHHFLCFLLLKTQILQFCEKLLTLAELDVKSFAKQLFFYPISFCYVVAISIWMTADLILPIVLIVVLKAWMGTCWNL